MRFANNTQAYWWSASASSELQDMLINELAAGKAFYVLDRQDLYSLLEQKFTEALLIDARTTKLKPGKIRGIRYFIVATVSAFEESTSASGTVASFPGFSSEEEQNKAYVAFNLKVIDREAGAVIDSHSISATSLQNVPAVSGCRFHGSLGKREKTPVGKAIRNCIIETARYLECSLAKKDKQCAKKYEDLTAKRKEKSKSLIQLYD